MDYGSRHLPSNMYSILPTVSQQLCASDNQYASPYGGTTTVANSSAAANYAVSQLSYRKVTSQSPVAATGLSPTDAYDASSSDSGFEEVVTITATTEDAANAKMIPPVVSNNEEVYAFQGGFKAY